jgi:hypothetical protein
MSIEKQYVEPARPCLASLRSASGRHAPCARSHGSPAINRVQGLEYARHSAHIGRSAHDWHAPCFAGKHWHSAADVARQQPPNALSAGRSTDASPSRTGTRGNLQAHPRVRAADALMLTTQAPTCKRGTMNRSVFQGERLGPTVHCRSVSPLRFVLPTQTLVCVENFYSARVRPGATRSRR